MLLFREGAGSDDNVVVNATKPTQSKIVTLPCNRDGAVRAATAFVRPTLGDGFEEEDIGLRLTNARELPDAIEVRIFRLSPLSRDRNLECVGRRTSLLMKLSDPAAMPAVGSELVLNEITEEDSAFANGTAKAARIVGRDGGEVFTCDVGDASSDATIKLTPAEIVAGAPVRISSFRLAMP